MALLFQAWLQADGLPKLDSRAASEQCNSRRCSVTGGDAPPGCCGTSRSSPRATGRCSRRLEGPFSAAGQMQQRLHWSPVTCNLSHVRQSCVIHREVRYKLCVDTLSHSVAERQCSAQQTIGRQHKGNHAGPKAPSTSFPPTKHTIHNTSAIQDSQDSQLCEHLLVADTSRQCLTVGIQHTITMAASNRSELEVNGIYTPAGTARVGFRIGFGT